MFPVHSQRTDSGTFDRGRHGSLTANAVPGSTLACSGVFSIRNSPKSVNMGTSEPDEILSGEKGAGEGGGEGSEDGVRGG